jgi:hypothetical protein
MRQLAVAVLLSLAVAACSGIDAYDGERSLNRRGIPPGPGLFSGPAGEWTIMRREPAIQDRAGPADDYTSEGTTKP